VRKRKNWRGGEREREREKRRGAQTDGVTKVENFMI
jgi:hypothetical protein